MVSSSTYSTSSESGSSSGSLISPRQESLRSLLSQPGLPYSEDLKDRIKVHLLSLVLECPSLLLSVSPFFEKDGSCLDLLQADGTIPIRFYGSSYNIPVTIWLLESYPVACPLVYVSPTHDMIIKQQHKHVDGSGMVSVPYLDGWAYPRSNIADLVRSVSAVFSRDPPLFSTVAVSTDATAELSGSSNNPALTQLQPIHMPFVSSHFHASNPYPFAPSFPRAPATPLPHASELDRMMPGQKDFGITASDPSEVFRKKAINALSARIELGLSEIRSTFEANLDNLEITQFQLKQNYNLLKLAKDQMRKDRDCLEQQVKALNSNTKAVEAWIGKHRNPLRQINIDDVFVPYDASSQQMVEWSSADLAIEDLLFALDKAVRVGCIPMDTYLKQVRGYAREQFFYRLWSNRVEAAQRQKQLSNMAARYNS